VTPLILAVKHKNWMLLHLAFEDLKKLGKEKAIKILNEPRGEQKMRFLDALFSSNMA
jgi:hypothetical protein